VGNTAFRIRGTDATRINVTLNGMPLNNPMSSEVFWVNLPDLSSSLQSIQLQRGVGTSTNGGSAFGASLSLQTAGGRSNAYGEASTSLGSYNTFQSTIAAGTGILENGLSFDVRSSRITSDGYIRNAFVDHNNLYLSLSHYTDRQLLRFVYLRGRQKTGITWNGVSQEQMREFGRRYNPAGEYFDSAGNRLYYSNETDNYFSDIAQLIYTRNLNDFLDLNTNLSYNYGFGYYENYRANRRFSDFGLQPQVIDGVTHARSDVIRRKMMENHFYVGNVALNYRRNAWNVQTGLMLGIYTGDHFGKLPWVKYNSTISPNDLWYDNTSRKQDFSIFARAEYQINNKWTAFGDVQGRFISLKLEGYDDDFPNPTDLTSQHHYNFFNPKAGIFFRPNLNNSLYASISIGNREPLRNNFKDAMQTNHEVLPERMYDFELGYRWRGQNAHFGANFYYMLYNNQLVHTGRLSGTGSSMLENVKDSYRTGIELEGGISFARHFRFDANTTLSRNKIKNYTARYAIDWSATDYVTEAFKNTDISFSPSVVGSSTLNYQPLQNVGFRLTGIYVSSQFMDNMADDASKLDAYFVSNFSVSYRFKPMSWGATELDLFVNNFFNNKYIANGWSVKTVDSEGNPSFTQGFFPQATRNLMTRITIRF
jgi:iron complex outermembrane receptor protein